MTAVLNDFVGQTPHKNEIPMLRRKARISGKECVVIPALALNSHPIEEVSELLKDSLQTIQNIFDSSSTKIDKLSAEVKAFLGEDAEKIKINFNVSDLAIQKIDVSSINPAPLQRVLGEKIL